jgi:hypothetical protein
MFDMTLTDALALLAKVNIAIEDLLLGKRVTEYKIASADFNRFYRYEELSLDSLTAFRADLRSYISSIDSTAVPVFRSNTCIPLVVRK